MALWVLQTVLHTASQLFWKCGCIYFFYLKKQISAGTVWWRKQKREKHEFTSFYRYKFNHNICESSFIYITCLTSTFFRLCKPLQSRLEDAKILNYFSHPLIFLEYICSALDLNWMFYSLLQIFHGHSCKLTKENHLSSHLYLLVKLFIHNLLNFKLQQQVLMTKRHGNCTSALMIYDIRLNSYSSKAVYGRQKQ